MTKRRVGSVGAAAVIAAFATTAPAFAAKLWVKNETRQYLWASIDGARRCNLAVEESCTLELSRGNHQLRLQRADGSVWQDSYNYTADDIIHCFVRVSAVNCSRTGGLFD